MTTIKELEKECKELEKKIDFGHWTKDDVDMAILKVIQRHLAHLKEMREKVENADWIEERILAEERKHKGKMNWRRIACAKIKLQLKAELFGEEGGKK